MYTVAVSYLEWIRWIATGWFRCAYRVVWVEGTEDQQGMDALMARTPDLQVADDQGYVIARLKSDALQSDRRSGPERSVGLIWLNVASVSCFYPLSTRGARLLEADAERAAVRLGEPIFEKAWGDWRDRQLEDEAHWRGRSLCAALGLMHPDLTIIPGQVGDILAGRKSTPNAAKVRDGAFEGTRALGWVSAMSVALISPSVDDAFKKTPEYENIRTIIKSLRDDLKLQRPLLDDEVMIRTVRGIDCLLRDLGAEVLPLELMATVLHYRSLALRGREISLGALLDDLASIALEDPQHACLSAYFIGRSMEDVAVSTLLYQSDAGRYTALSPAAGRQHLDVMALAGDRFAAKQPVEQVLQQNPGTQAKDKKTSASEAIDTTSALNQEDSVGEAQLHIEPDSKTRDDVEGNLEVSPSSLDGGSIPETPAQNALADSEEPTEADASRLSESGVDESIQHQELKLEPQNDLFQQTMEAVEPVTASTKSKRNKKKSNKTPEITSAEISDDKSAT